MIPPRGQVVGRELVLPTESGFPGVIRGMVLDAGTREPVPDVDVTFPESGFRTLTDVDGSFTYREASPGFREVTAVALGYEPFADVIEVRPRRIHDLTLFLVPEALEIEGVTVSVERRLPAALEGMRHRREVASHAFVPREVIETRAVTGRLLETARGRAGLRFTTTGAPFFSRSPNCEPTVLIDGMPVSAGRANALAAGDVETIEVYGGPSTIPGSLFQNGRCGLIAVWTRRGGG